MNLMCTKYKQNVETRPKYFLRKTSKFDWTCSVVFFNGPKIQFSNETAIQNYEQKELNTITLEVHICNFLDLLENQSVNQCIP